MIQSDLIGMVKWPFQGVKWPPTRGWKGHFESPGIYCFTLKNIEESQIQEALPKLPRFFLEGLLFDRGFNINSGYKPYFKLSFLDPYEVGPLPVCK